MKLRVQDNNIKQQSFQNTKFDFPEFDGEMAGCEYQDNHQWNCASIYCKKSSQSIFILPMNLVFLDISR